MGVVEQAKGERTVSFPPPAGGQPAPSYPPPPAEPTFQVRTVKHTGAVIFWLNQRYTTTGSYAQCRAAIDAAEQHCLIGGWWSIGSLLWNPISLSQNSTARKTLRQQAQQAHDYAQWWSTYYGGGTAPVWTPPPDPPARPKWWRWIPLGLLGLLFLLFVVLAIVGGHDEQHGATEPWAPVPLSSTPDP